MMTGFKQKCCAFFRVCFGVYALTVWAIFLIIGGVIILVLPGLGYRRRVARRALRMMFALSGTPCRFSHLDRLPKSPCVVIANHRSFLDGLVLIAALPPHFRPVIKFEMKQVPIIGRVLARFGSSYVKRTPVQRAGRDTLYVYNKLLAGDSLAIFPEGAFSPDAGLLPFRDGAFLLAAKADVPVVPVAMAGTSSVLPDGAILPRPGRVAVEILDPVRASGRDDEAIRQLRSAVEKALKHKLDHAPGERARSSSGGDQNANHARHALLANEPMPLAYLDIDALERNIRMLVDKSGGKDLRVNASALQCPEIVERVVRSHARFKGAVCATMDQAHRLLERQDINDVTVAFPTLAERSLDRACREINAGHAVRLTVDSPRQIASLAKAAARADVTVPVVIEFDCSRAVRRASSIRRRSAVCDLDILTGLVATIDDTSGVVFDGVTLFDVARNHVFNATNRRYSGDKRTNARSARRIRDYRAQIAKALEDRQMSFEIFACDGNRAPDVDAIDPVITEMIVGDALYGLNPNDPDDEAAAGLGTEIIRQTDESRYACLGGGTICAATADSGLLPTPFDPDAELDLAMHAGKRQLTIRHTGRLELGQPIFMRPPNASELCERFDELVLIQDNAIVGHAPTDRALASRAVCRDE